MGRGEFKGGKEQELRHKGEPSMREGEWGDYLTAFVRFNEESNKQAYLYLTRVKLCITDSLVDIQK